MPKTREMIANELGISVPTLWRKIKNSELEIPRGPVFSIDEWRIKMLFNLVPPPEIMDQMKRIENPTY